MNPLTPPPLRWDAHECLPLHPEASFAPLEALRQAGVHYVSINVGMDMNPVSQVMAVLASFRARIAQSPDQFALVRRVADIDAARGRGQLAVGFDLEGALPLMALPEMVALYSELGVRQMHLAYNRNNSVAGGCHDVEQGLTALGHRVVQAINAAGVLMDCSHTGRRCSLEIMAASSAPVIFSHANPLALAEHGRNITDEQIKACAATGGVVCISSVSKFLGADSPTAADIARHAAYVAERVGTAHVGIGLDIGFHQPDLNDKPPGDYQPSYWWPAAAGYGQGIRGMSYAPVTAWAAMDDALQRCGMSAQDAALVMGENMRRVAQQVWG